MQRNEGFYARKKRLLQADLRRLTSSKEGRFLRNARYVLFADTETLLSSFLPLQRVRKTLDKLLYVLLMRRLAGACEYEARRNGNP